MKTKDKILADYVWELHELLKPLCWDDVWRVISAYITLTKPEKEKTE